MFHITYATEQKGCTVEANPIYMHNIVQIVLCRRFLEQ